MSARFLLFGVLSINFMLAVAAESGGWIARAASRPGDVPGVTRDPGGLLVVPKAQIILRSGQGGPERSVVSGADGAFFVADLEPGCCEATAWKRGFASSSITLKVTAGQTTEVDLPLGQSTDLQKPPKPNQDSFFRRFLRAYPWVGAPDAKPTFNGCVAYTWRDGRDNHYACVNSLNSGKYAYNNVQSVYYTWYHKFGHSSWHTDTEWWYMWETDVPNVNPASAPAAAASLLESNANGAWCDSPQQLSCRAAEQAVVNYVEKQVAKHDYFTIRNELFDDGQGQRTGFKTKYSEHLLGWGHWIATTILLRPELRYERSYDVPAYNNGTKKDQLVFASDLIFFF
jgi:hypothetical protein